MNSIPRSQAFDPGQASDIPDTTGIFGQLEADAARETRQSTNANTLAAMLSGARSLTPLLEAVVFTPGLGAPQEDLQHAIETMLDAANRIAAHAMHTLDIDDTPHNEWAKSVLMQLAVGGVAEQWKAHGHAEPSAWLAIIDNVVDAGVTQRTRDYPDIADQTAYQVSHFAALSTIASEVRRFAFFFDATALLERLSTFLDQKVADATDAVLAGVETRDADRLMVEQGLLKHASHLFAEIYRENAEQTLLEVSGMGADERKQFVATGQPAQRVESVREAFDGLFATLTRTSRLRAEQCVARSRAPAQGLS